MGAGKLVKYVKSKKSKKEPKKLATKAYVKKAINMSNELKEFILASSRTAYNQLADTVWEQNSLGLIGQGDTSTGTLGRDGDKISVAYITSRTNILTSFGGLTEATGLDPFQVRIIMYQCKRGFTPAQVMASFPTNGALAPLGNVTLRKAEILYDKYFTHRDFQVVGQQAAGTSGASFVFSTNYLMPVKISKKPKIKIVQWNPASTTNVDADVIGAPMLAYCFFNNVGGGADIGVSVLTTPDSRITYRDK